MGRSDRAGRHPGRVGWPLACALAAASLAAIPARVAWPAPGANGLPVVLIVIDTLRADHLGLYGYSRPTSPALDAFGERAAVFERAFSTAPWTLPSFASIYTGRLPSRHVAGVVLEDPKARRKHRGNAHAVLGVSYSGIDPALPTLAEVLQAHGYATGAVVSNPFLHPGFGVARGFDSYDYAGALQTRSADVAVDRALAYMRTHRKRPFFLLLHLMDPHMSYDPDPSVRGRFTHAWKSRFSLPVKDLLKIRAAAPSLGTADRGFITAAYDEEVAFVDAQLGRFFRALDALGLGDRALVIVTADHGEELFDHGGFDHGHTLYDELLHVPLLLRGPGVKPGRRSTPVSLLDLTPTILAAAGLPAPPAPFAVSLWPSLAGSTPVPPRTLFAERTLYGDPREAVIRWPLKLAVDAASGEKQLFDLSDDPGERRNRAASDPETLARLLEALRSGLRIAREAAATPEAARVDEPTRERLRALGYTP